MEFLYIYAARLTSDCCRHNTHDGIAWPRAKAQGVYTITKLQAPRECWHGTGPRTQGRSEGPRRTPNPKLHLVHRIWICDGVDPTPSASHGPGDRGRAARVGVELCRLNRSALQSVYLQLHSCPQQHTIAPHSLEVKVAYQCKLLHYIHSSSCDEPTLDASHLICSCAMCGANGIWSIERRWPGRRTNERAMLRPPPSRG